MKISLIFFSLVSGLSVAMLALMPMIPQKSIGKNFFRFICFLSLILIIPFLPFNPYKNFRVPFLSANGLENPLLLIQGVSWLFVLFGLALVILLGFFTFKKKDSKPVSPFIYGSVIFLGVAGLLCDSLLYLPHLGSLWWENILIPINLLSSAALFGTVMFAMLLGHWYLVQFDLDKRLLKRVCLAYCIAVAVRILFIGLTLAVYWKTQTLDAEGLASLLKLDGHGIFFWTRIIVGLGLPLVLAFMIYSTAKMGANQACTGLLYIAVLFVIMGEMISRYVFFLKGIPI
jgi:DMSO reductase anchor subunit